MVLLGNSTLNGKINLKTAKDSILNEEKRKKRTSTCESHVLVTESQERSQSRFSYSKQDRESGNRKGKWKSREKSLSRKGIKCYYCAKPGYIQKDCRKYERDKKGKDEDKNERMVQPQLYLMVMLSLFAIMVMLILTFMYEFNK